MGLGDIFKSVIGGKTGMDISSIDLPLDSTTSNALNTLIGSGVFKDKSDFMNFALKAYMQSNMGSMMSSGQQPTESSIMDVISKTGIDRGRSQSDIKMLLVPLLITAFTAIYKHMSKRQSQAMPPQR